MCCCLASRAIRFPHSWRSESCSRCKESPRPQLTTIWGAGVTPDSVTVRPVWLERERRNHRALCRPLCAAHVIRHDFHNRAIVVTHLHHRGTTDSRGDCGPLVDTLERYLPAVGRPIRLHQSWGAHDFDVYGRLRLGLSVATQAEAQRQGGQGSSRGAGVMASRRGRTTHVNAPLWITPAIGVARRHPSHGQSGHEQARALDRRGSDVDIDTMVHSGTPPCWLRLHLHPRTPLQRHGGCLCR